jgi:hypothetical protein
MNSMQMPTGAMGAIRIIVFILIAIAIYYIYRYFFTADILEKVVLLKGITDAKRTTNKTALPTFAADAVPPLYEGGEYSMSCWVYINDWTHRKGQQKHIFEIGATDPTATINSKFITLLVGLSNNKNKLMVRLHTKNDTSLSSIFDTNNRPQTATHAIMNNTGVEDNLTLSALPMCDLPEIDMQRWVLVSVVLTGKICDVYLDGKLARSCTLPSFFRVDNGYSIKPLLLGGFGGYISNLTAYGYALNPSDVYKIYLSGPNSEMSVLEWFASFLNPKVTSFYPKMNNQ